MRTYVKKSIAKAPLYLLTTPPDKKVEMQLLFFNMICAGPELIWDYTELQNIKILFNCDQSIS